MPVKKAVKAKPSLAKAKKLGRVLKLRTISGTVVSDKMDKTVVVAVNILKKHPKYHKRYRSTKKYKVHDPKNQFKQGEQASFVSCRPISRNKRWRVVY